MEGADDGGVMRDFFLGGRLLAAAFTANLDGTRAQEERRVDISEYY